MIQRDLTIVNKLGLHARAAAKFVTTASSYQAAIQVTKGGRIVNGKSIMGVMMLAAGMGSEIEIETDGEDERSAMDALRALIGDKFGEAE